MLQSVLLGLLLLVSAQARADELTPRFEKINALAKQGTWTQVLDELAEFAPGARLDYRYFYWRSVAFYRRDWVDAGNEEARLAKKYLEAAPLSSEERGQYLKALEAEQARARERQTQAVDKLLAANKEQQFATLKQACGTIRWTGRFAEDGITILPASEAMSESDSSSKSRKNTTIIPRHKPGSD